MLKPFYVLVNDNKRTIKFSIMLTQVFYGFLKHITDHFCH